MTSYKQLSDLAAQIEAAERAVERHYRIGNKPGICIHVWGEFRSLLWARSERPEIRCVRVGVVDFSGAYAQLDDFSPAELVQIADIKAVIDRWIDGSLDALPPSTVTDDDRSSWGRDRRATRMAKGG